MSAYRFDPALEAVTAPKERIVWLIFMGIVFFLLYGASNQFAAITAPHISLFMSWERDIPFIESFIVPYMSSDLMFVIAFLLPYTRLEIRILAARVLFIVLFSIIIFALFPLQFGFEKPKVESYNLLFTALKADLPFNQLPSLHISFAIVLYASMERHLKNSLVRLITLVWFSLIALSTLFVYQHHFIDLPTGAFMGLLALFIIKKDQKSFFVSQFSTPRSLKMGLYFLTAACVFMILSFTVEHGMAILFYLFISLFSVALVYAFGLNNLLAGKDARASLLHWIIFFPYFLGSRLSWMYFKGKIDLMTKVKDNVYLGRLPSAKEYSKIKDNNIAHIINLATEQQWQKPFQEEIRFPYLDQTIQAPHALHQGVLFIEANKENGVYVHCALGLSRSVLLISAWLLYQKYTLAEIDTLMAKLRPAYVRSVYMDLTLQFYLKFLEDENIIV